MNCNMMLLVILSLCCGNGVEALFSYVDRCQDVLGMEKNEIPDSALSASSSSSDDFLPKYARIRQNEGGGAWCPNGTISRGSYEYLQVDFDEMKVISISETQGRFNKGKGTEYMEQYKLEFQREDGGPWIIYRNHRGQDVLPGNSNTYGVVLQVLDPPVIARRIRVVPYSETPITVCARLEFYGCTWKDHMVWYSMPQGMDRGKIELADFLYDGKNEDGLLIGGLGQLTDGEQGDTDFKVDPNNIGQPGYPWIGWQNTALRESPVELVFKFDSVRNFTEVMMYSNNYYTKDVAVFSRAEILFSFDGKTFSTDQPLVFSYQPDRSLVAARPVHIPLDHRIGRYVTVKLYFEQKWIMMSEVEFVSEPVPEENTTLAAVPVTPPASSAGAGGSTAKQSPEGAVPSSTAGPASSYPGVPNPDKTNMPGNADSSKSTRHPNTDGGMGYDIRSSSTVAVLGPAGGSADSTTLAAAPGKSHGNVDEIHIAIIVAVLIVFLLIMLAALIICCVRRRRKNKKKREAASYPNDCIRNYNGRGTYGYDKTNGLYRQDPGGSGLTSCCSNLNTSSTYSDLPDTNSLRHHHLGDFPKSGSLSDTYAVPDIMQSTIVGSPDDPTITLLPRGGDLLPPPPYPPVGTISGNLVHHQSPQIPMYQFSQSPALAPNNRTFLPPIPPPPLPIGTFSGPYATSDLGRNCHQSRASTPGSMGGRDRPKSVIGVGGIQGVTGSSVYAVASSDPPSSNLGLPEIPYSQLVFRQKIGSGHFGEVYLATTRGHHVSGRSSVASLLAQGDMLVAVKMLKPIADARTREAFERETQLMWKLEDPNIVQVLGVSPDTETQPLGIVLEYMPHGDLYQFLRDAYTQANNVPQLSNGCLIYMATQVASGMKYLESLNMVHRDLATRNCLVGPDYLIKIGDFGMSRALFSSDYYSMEGQALLPIRWMAWESILYSKFSPRSDVWSFGVTLWEMFTFAREQPYSSMCDEDVINNANNVLYQNGKQVILRAPESCPPEIYSFMCQCWQRDTSHRPSFIEAHNFLQQKNLGFHPKDTLTAPDYSQHVESDTESEADEQTPVHV